MQAHKRLTHGPGESFIRIFVQGKVLAAPVDACAQSLHLVQDRATVLFAPLPRTPDEPLPPQLLTRGAFTRKLALHHHLCRNAGVVGAGHPERPVAAHAVPASKDVHFCLVQHMAHVQAARYIGRRQQHGERRAFRLGSRGIERFRRGLPQVFTDPAGSPALFNGGGIVCFGEVAWHRSYGGSKASFSQECEEEALMAHRFQRGRRAACRAPRWSARFRPRRATARVSGFLQPGPAWFGAGVRGTRRATPLPRAAA